jgi:hypothetical protein
MTAKQIEQEKEKIGANYSSKPQKKRKIEDEFL